MDAFHKICKLAGEAVADYKLIAENDFILCGVSGGKDSMVLLRVLDHFRKKAPVKFRLEAVTFDPGYEGFDVAAIRKFCSEMNVPHHTVKVRVEDVIRRTETEHKPCVLCSRLRRGKLYGIAKELGAEKLALGQHMDDIAVSFLISACRGKGLTTMSPKTRSDEGSVQVIRPLAYVPESLTVQAAKDLQIPVRGECKYRDQLENEGDRAYFKRLLRQIERNIPDVVENLRHSLSDVRPGHLMDRRFMK